MGRKKTTGDMGRGGKFLDPSRLSRSHIDTVDALPCHRLHRDYCHEQKGMMMSEGSHRVPSFEGRNAKKGFHDSICTPRSGERLVLVMRCQREGFGNMGIIHVDTCQPSTVIGLQGSRSQYGGSQPTHTMYDESMTEEGVRALQNAQSPGKDPSNNNKTPSSQVPPEQKSHNCVPWECVYQPSIPNSLGLGLVRKN